MHIKKLNKDHVLISHKIENGFFKKTFEYKNYNDWKLAEDRLNFFSQKSGLGKFIPEYNWKRSSNIFFVEQRILNKSFSTPSLTSLKKLANNLDDLNLYIFPHGDLNRKNLILSQGNFYLVDIEPIIAIEAPNNKRILRSTPPYIHKKDIEENSVTILSDLLGYFCFILKIKGLEHSIIKKNYNQLCNFVQLHNSKSKPFLSLFDASSKYLSQIT